jgi:ATP-binding cassette subfamily F protein uup
MSELSPDKGTVKVADGIRLVYFDQHREQLENDIPLRRALAPEGDTVYYRGQSIHVNSWCKRFLFSPDRLDLPFGHLSGGERARVHLARLMLKPADILLLDEPTNDLDIPTLEILEESLAEFPGAVVLITHDRYLLDQISTVILGLGGGNEGSLFADYLQWEQHQIAQPEEKKEKETKKPAPRIETRAKKMTYSEKREWEQMEEKIFALEESIAQLEKIVHDPSLATQPERLQKTCAELDEKNKLLEMLFHRWEELESMRS